MSAEIPRVKSLSLKQIQKATRNFSPVFMLGEGRIWTVYRAVLPDNHIVVVRRAKKVVPCFRILYPFFIYILWSSKKAAYQLLVTLAYWSCMLCFVEKLFGLSSGQSLALSPGSVDPDKIL